MPTIVATQLKVGLEIHIQLATRCKMFSRAPSPAAREFEHAAPNTLVDPTVLGLPGALPVINGRAIELSMQVGLALGCSIAPVTRWDRKSYFYPDMPKNYQISQYQLPLCFDGSVELPSIAHDANGNPEFDVQRPVKKIGIIRAHLEEDAGKLLHEIPGGGRTDASFIDLNRAGTALLEVVTQPDFSSADEVVMFAHLLRGLCRFLRVTQGVMQRGHIRFEPNINLVLTLDDGRLIYTPIVEVKNLNSFKALRGAIEFEHAQQPHRWLQTGIEFGPGSKATRGWEEVSASPHGGRTVLQREKEDAHDYRYFPDPDLLPVRVEQAWIESVRASIPELPLARVRRYQHHAGLTPKEAAALVDERAVCDLYEAAVDEAVRLGVPAERAGKQAANFILQSGAKRANGQTLARRDGQNDASDDLDVVLVSDLGVSAQQIAQIVKLKEDGQVGSNQADQLFGLLCEPVNRGIDAGTLALRHGLLLVRDAAALARWCEQAIAEQPKAAQDVRAGKSAAIGRLVGAAMKASAGQGDAAQIREQLEKML